MNWWPGRTAAPEEEAPRMWTAAEAPMSMFLTRTQHSVSFTGLIASLHSRYEAVRESAARWLGRGRQQLVGHDKADEVVRELNNLLKHEESERVRAAASR